MGKVVRIGNRVRRVCNGTDERGIKECKDQLSELLNRVEELCNRINTLPQTAITHASPLEYNSFYVDRFPDNASDFGDWPESNRQVLFERFIERERHRFIDQVMGCFSAYGNRSVGDYYEFGVCGAGTFRVALAKAKKWHLEPMRFYAFDSFKGLPTDGSLAMSEEDFWASIRAPGINVDKVTTIPGFYDKSLTPELQKQFVARGKPVDFVNIDCDLHESAVPVLRFISPLIRPGSVIYLDEFYSTFKAGKNWGTARAFYEFADNHPTLKFYPYIRSGWWGLSFKAYDPRLFPHPVF